MGIHEKANDVQGEIHKMARTSEWNNVVDFESEEEVELNFVAAEVNDFYFLKCVAVLVGCSGQVTGQPVVNDGLLRLFLDGGRKDLKNESNMKFPLVLVDMFCLFYGFTVMKIFDHWLSIKRSISL